jgi:hypothetical protein
MKKIKTYEDFVNEEINLRKAAAGVVLGASLLGGMSSCKKTDIKPISQEVSSNQIKEVSIKVFNTKMKAIMPSSINWVMDTDYNINIKLKCYKKVNSGEYIDVKSPGGDIVTRGQYEEMEDIITTNIKLPEGSIIFIKFSLTLPKPSNIPTGKYLLREAFVGLEGYGRDTVFSNPNPLLYYPNTNVAWPVCFDPGHNTIFSFKFDSNSYTNWGGNAYGTITNKESDSSGNLSLSGYSRIYYVAGSNERSYIQ